MARRGAPGACAGSARCRRRACCPARSRRGARRCRRARRARSPCRAGRRAPRAGGTRLGSVAARRPVARDGAARAGSSDEALAAGRRRVAGWIGSTEERLQAGDHLLDVEGLGDVVVAAGGEAAEPVGERVTRGEEQDRCADPLRPQRLAEVAAVRVRQPDVDDEGGGRGGLSALIEQLAPARRRRAPRTLRRGGCAPARRAAARRPRRSAGVGCHARRKYRAVAERRPPRSRSGDRQVRSRTLPPCTSIHKLSARECSWSRRRSWSAGCGSSSSAGRRA